MPSSSCSTTSNDECEYCHSAYTLIKRKKNCAICHQYYCTNCAPRKHYYNHSYRICLICQLISSDSTTDEQLLELKVKHLRLYLQAKNISHHTCTEKQELVDLIIRNRHIPFSHLFIQQTQTSPINQQQSHTTMPPPHPPPKSGNHSGPFTNIQHTVSSFANQLNNFASNIQDYVTNTVSDVVNNTIGDQQSTITVTNNPSTNTANRATVNPQQQQQQRRAPRPEAAAAAASSTSTPNQRTRRKSLSEIKNEENIEDLNIRELKEILATNFVDYKGCVEKSELIDKVRRLYRDRQNEKIKTGDSTTSDNELCKICMDAIADCVFLDCGHMVTCVKCGRLLAECPICRSNIVRVLRVFKS